jgi:predicted TIM-barrel fold metal-dependent hydrolase
MADWAAEAALHHHGATRYNDGEYPQVFAEFFAEFPEVTYCGTHCGFVYTWVAQEVSILIQD